MFLGMGSYEQEVKFLKTCGLRRVTQGYTGLHFVQLGASVIFYFLAFLKIFLGSGHWQWPAVTSWSHCFAPQVSKDDYTWFKMAFLWLTVFFSVRQFSAWSHLVTPCDQLVTPGHTFILILKAQGIFLQSFIKIGQRLGPFENRVPQQQQEQQVRGSL